MPVTGATIRVQGLRELTTAFARIDSTMSKNLRAELRHAAEPVKVDAETLAVARIPRVGMEWSRMRVGVTRSTVYVAPRARGKRSRGDQRFRRPNLAGLLLSRSLLPALNENEQRILVRVETLLARMSGDWGRGG